MGKNITELNGIKIGDTVVVENDGFEIKGSIVNIYNENYIVNTVIGSSSKTKAYLFDQILEHYPVNVKLQNNLKIDEDKIITPSIYSDFRKDPNYGNKNKSVVFFPDEMKQKDINSILPHYKESKYFIVEKNNELHIVKIKDGFDMKPFVENLINHFIKKKMISENISNMKVKGNSSFVIISNPPIKFKSLIKLALKNILK